MQRIPIRECLVGLAVFISACVALRLTRVAGGIALFWPSSAVGAALLIRFRELRCAPALLAMAGALFLSDVLVAHRPWLTATSFAAINICEIGLMLAAFRIVWVFPYPDISTAQAAIMTLVFGIAIPGVTAAFGAAMLNSNLSLAWGEGTLQWWSAHAIGACLLGPPIILFSRDGLFRLLRGRHLMDNAVTGLACMAGCFLTIHYVRFPFVSMGVLLLIAAFRMGGFGVSLISLGFGLMITNLWIIGIRPMGLTPPTQ